MVFCNVADDETGGNGGNLTRTANVAAAESYAERIDGVTEQPKKEKQSALRDAYHLTHC